MSNGLTACPADALDDVVSKISFDRLLIFTFLKAKAASSNAWPGSRVRTNPDLHRYPCWRCRLSRWLPACSSPRPHSGLSRTDFASRSSVATFRICAPRPVPVRVSNLQSQLPIIFREEAGCGKNVHPTSRVRRRCSHSGNILEHAAINLARKPWCGRDGRHFGFSWNAGCG